MEAFIHRSILQCFCITPLIACQLDEISNNKLLFVERVQSLRGYQTQYFCHHIPSVIYSQLERGDGGNGGVKCLAQGHTYHNSSCPGHNSNPRIGQIQLSEQIGPRCQFHSDYSQI